MRTLHFSADSLTFEKNIVTFLSSGELIYSKSGSFLIPIIEISAINWNLHSEETLISILLKNGITVSVNLKVKLAEAKKYRTTFDNFIESWKSRFDSKTADLLDLK